MTRELGMHLALAVLGEVQNAPKAAVDDADSRGEIRAEVLKLLEAVPATLSGPS